MDRDIEERLIHLLNKSTRTELSKEEQAFYDEHFNESDDDETLESTQ